MEVDSGRLRARLEDFEHVSAPCLHFSTNRRLAIRSRTQQTQQIRTKDGEISTRLRRFVLLEDVITTIEILLDGSRTTRDASTTQPEVAATETVCRREMDYDVRVVSCGRLYTKISGGDRWTA